MSGLGTAHGYTGEMEDDNGLVFLRARYYHQDTGTFVSQDPLEGDISGPMSLNRYTYAYGNPVNNTDLSGMIGERPWDGCAPFQGDDEDPCRYCVGFEHVFCALGITGPCLPPSPEPTQEPPRTPFPTFPTNTPRFQPTPTAPINPCDPSLLPPITEVLRAFSGSRRLDPGQPGTRDEYVWREQPVTGVAITYYGSRALRTPGVTHPSQLPRQEAWNVCCGQGSVAIGDRSYRCNISDADRLTLCQNSANAATFQFDWVAAPDRCEGHPYLANETCAVPGQTGAVRPDTGLAGHNIGRMFAFVIPPSGNPANGFPVYLNDAGTGVNFQDRQIDVYAGVLDENSSVINGVHPDFVTQNATVCLLARQGIMEEYTGP